MSCQNFPKIQTNENQCELLKLASTSYHDHLVSSLIQKNTITDLIYSNNGHVKGVLIASLDGWFHEKRKERVYVNFFSNHSFGLSILVRNKGKSTK